MWHGQTAYMFKSELDTWVTPNLDPVKDDSLIELEGKAMKKSYV